MQAGKKVFGLALGPRPTLPSWGWSCRSPCTTPQPHQQIKALLCGLPALGRRGLGPPWTTWVVVHMIFAWCYSLFEFKSLWVEICIPSSTSIVKGILYAIIICTYFDIIWEALVGFSTMTAHQVFEKCWFSSNLSICYLTTCSSALQCMCFAEWL